MSFNTGGAFERMRILGTNGFVGIGTTTPNYTLEVNGTIAAQKIMITTTANQTSDVQQTITDMQQEIQTLKTKIAEMEKFFVAKN